MEERLQKLEDELQDLRHAMNTMAVIVAVGDHRELNALRMQMRGQLKDLISRAEQRLRKYIDEHVDGSALN
jgi:hypothetical protein